MRILRCALSAMVLVGCSGDGATSIDEELGDPNKIDVGFNMGHMDQFAYIGDFFSAPSAVHDKHLCHTYVVWDVGTEPPAAPNASAPQGTRAWLEAWLQQAQGKCDDVMISFQAHASAKPPSPAAFQTAFQDFVSSSWPYTGTFSFTPWNEPNNPGGAGNGLGVVIPADLDAEYYLTAEEICRKHGCKVAFGDLASNGNWWKDFSWNCPNDNVAPSQLCSDASYLDRMKNYIANFADGKTSSLGRKHHLPSGFRPEYFAFHGWHDINQYLSDGNHCGTYEDCATRRILKNLGGSWSGTKLWDTEVGVDQDGPAISDGEQACGAAFLVRLSALSARITRVYYTRLHGGTGELIGANHARRQAAEVLAKRDTSSGGHCK